MKSDKEYKRMLRDLYRASFYTEEELEALWKSHRALKYPSTNEERRDRGYSDYYAGLSLYHIYQKDEIRALRLKRILQE